MLPCQLNDGLFHLCSVQRCTGVLNRINQREMEALFVQMEREVCQVLTGIRGSKAPQSEVLTRRPFR